MSKRLVKVLCQFEVEVDLKDDEEMTKEELTEYVEMNTIDNISSMLVNYDDESMELIKVIGIRDIE